MSNFLSRAIASIQFFLKGLQVKNLLVVALVSVSLFTATVNSGQNNRDLTSAVSDRIHQDDSQRPKTTGEWNQEARETQGSPGERAKRITKESAEAVKDFGSVYPDTAQRSASELRQSSNMNQ